MSKLLEEIRHSIDATIPEMEELPSMSHPKIDYIILVLRNAFVALATILFIISFHITDECVTLKAVAYFLGAGAYLFECLALADCFRKKVEHKEMFMVYCLGPLYILMGLNYIF